MTILNRVKIIFENSNFMVVDKPAGLVVHSDGRTQEESLIDCLGKLFNESGGEAAAQEQKNIGRPHTLDSERYIERWGIVNRLDRDTAGLILVAKNQNTFDALQKLFQEQMITKKYEALVWGNLEMEDRDEIAVDKKITRHKSDPRIWTCDLTPEEGGRQTGLAALTIVKKINYLEYKNQTLLSLEPKTGRTHQLRLHCRFLGHPIVGDDKYGLNGKINEHSARQILGVLTAKNIEQDNKEKLKLVAKSLRFDLDGKEYFFESGSFDFGN